MLRLLCYALAATWQLPMLRSLDSQYGQIRSFQPSICYARARGSAGFFVGKLKASATSLGIVEFQCLSDCSAWAEAFLDFRRESPLVPAEAHLPPLAGMFQGLISLAPSSASMCQAGPCMLPSSPSSSSLPSGRKGLAAEDSSPIDFLPVV